MNGYACLRLTIRCFHPKCECWTDDETNHPSTHKDKTLLDLPTNTPTYPSETEMVPTKSFYHFVKSRFSSKPFVIRYKLFEALGVIQSTHSLKALRVVAIKPCNLYNLFHSFFFFFLYLVRDERVDHVFLCQCFLLYKMDGHCGFAQHVQSTTLDCYI